MKLTDETKLFIGVFLVTALIIFFGIIIFSKPPPILTRNELLPAGTPTIGNEKASNFLVEFSDFQCPACKIYKDTLNSIEKKYKDKILIGYRHFPLEQHSFSVKAGLAAEAAGMQGKFWEMHNLLFDNQESLSDEKVIDLAKELNLDIEKFKTDWSKQEINDKVIADKNFGMKIGINSTPTFYLNGKRLNLTTPEELVIELEKTLGK